MCYEKNSVVRIVFLFIVAVGINNSYAQGFRIGDDSERIALYVQLRAPELRRMGIGASSDVVYDNGEIATAILCERNRYMVDIRKHVSSCKYYIMRDGGLDYVVTQYENLSVSEVGDNLGRSRNLLKIGNKYFSDDLRHVQHVYLADNRLASVRWEDVSRSELSPSENRELEHLIKEKERETQNRIQEKERERQNRIEQKRLDEERLERLRVENATIEAEKRESLRQHDIAMAKAQAVTDSLARIELAREREVSRLREEQMRMKQLKQYYCPKPSGAESESVADEFSMKRSEYKLKRVSRKFQRKAAKLSFEQLRRGAELIDERKEFLNSRRALRKVQAKEVYIDLLIELREEQVMDAMSNGRRRRYKFKTVDWTRGALELA